MKKLVLFLVVMVICTVGHSLSAEDIKQMQIASVSEEINDWTLTFHITKDLQWEYGVLYQDFKEMMKVTLREMAVERIKKGCCPVCGSKKRLTYCMASEAEDFISIDNVVFYVCAECGNVYAIREVKP